jgi:hypothetical protein
MDPDRRRLSATPPGSRTGRPRPGQGQLRRPALREPRRGQVSRREACTAVEVAPARPPHAWPRPCRRRRRAGTLVATNGGSRADEPRRARV